MMRSKRQVRLATYIGYKSTLRNIKIEWAKWHISLVGLFFGAMIIFSWQFNLQNTNHHCSRRLFAVFFFFFFGGGGGGRGGAGGGCTFKRK